MRAWHLREAADGKRTMSMEFDDAPTPGPGELLVAVDACGVCRTDLHMSAGDLPMHRPDVVPGHEIVGTVVGSGDGVDPSWLPGTRVGIPWLRYTCGECRFCRRGDENLCQASEYTSWDADGGFAEFTVAPAAYTLALPDGYSTAELAPMLCAGVIGHRALQRSALPDGGSIGLYGFGASAHLTAQIALLRGARVHVMTRGDDAVRLAWELGASSVQGVRAMPPEPLDSAIIFAPVGDIVPAALEAIGPGGTVALAGIHMSDVPPLNYQRHLFHEKRLVSVESNTRSDAREFLEIAAAHRLEVRVTTYPLDKAELALNDLDEGRFAGAAVLIP